jgi:hypothetical protein
VFYQVKALPYTVESIRRLKSAEGMVKRNSRPTWAAIRRRSDSLPAQFRLWASSASAAAIAFATSDGGLGDPSSLLGWA